MELVRTIQSLQNAENNSNGGIGNTGSSSSGIAGTSGNGQSTSSGCNVHEYSAMQNLAQDKEIQEPSLLCFTQFGFSRITKIFLQILSFILCWSFPFVVIPFLNLKSTDHDGNTIFSSAMIFSIIVAVCFLAPIFALLFSDKKKDTNVYKIDDEKSFKKKMKQHEQFIKDQQDKYKI